MNLKQLEARAATLGVDLSYDDRCPLAARGLTIRIRDFWFILINPDLELRQRTLALAHELAHIILGHSGNVLSGLVDMNQEDEANWLAWWMVDVD